MATATKPGKSEGEAPPKSKKRLIIGLLAILLLGVIMAVGVLFWLSKGNDHAEGGDEEGDEEVQTEVVKSKSKKTTPPVYVNLDPFTVNLVPEQGDQYMQVVLALELEDAESGKTLTEHMPRIRNNLTLTLSSKKASELVTKEGKEQLAEELRDEINIILAPPAKGRKNAPEGPVVSVLFTSFIIQ